MQVSSPRPYHPYHPCYQPTTTMVCPVCITAAVAANAGPIAAAAVSGLMAAKVALQPRKAPHAMVCQREAASHAKQLQDKVKRAVVQTGNVRKVRCCPN